MSHLFPPSEPYNSGKLDVGDGHRLTYCEHGNPEGIPVVYLHGGPGAGCNEVYYRYFDPSGFRIVTYDQRAAPLSPPEAFSIGGDPAALIESNTPEILVEDNERMREHLGIDRWHLFGGSWGATLAAGYMRHRPGRVRAAVLAEPGYLDHGEYLSWKERYDELMSGWAYMRVAIAAGFAAQRISGPDEHAAGDYLVGQRILPAFLDHPGNPYHLPGRRYGAPSWRWGRVAGEALAGETFDHETLDRVDGEQANGDTPVLFLASEHNSWIGETLQRRHAESFPGAGLAVIGDSGHDMFWDNPGETLAVVRRFLSDGVDGLGSSRLVG